MPKDNPRARKLKRKLQEHNNQFNLNIPMHLALAKGWKAGTVLTVSLNKKGNLEIEK